MPPNQPIIPFRNPSEFADWLETNHGLHPGIWMKIYKKDSGQPTITYTEALDVALCYGWIDGQKQRGDDQHWLQKFTRRGSRSMWSRINVGHVERLTKNGQMRPPGIAAVEAAKQDGRWDRAYTSPSRSEVPPDFLAALARFPKALAFFQTLNRVNRFAIAYRLETARSPEVRAKRMAEFLTMMKKRQKLH